VIDVTIALGMASSKTEARRLVDQGGVRLNGEPVRETTTRITEADLDESGTARLTVGKKRHGLIRRA
jgi:tyrosyl-tRNA synthetase